MVNKPSSGEWLAKPLRRLSCAIAHLPTVPRVALNPPGGWGREGRPIIHSQATGSRDCCGGRGGHHSATTEMTPHDIQGRGKRLGKGIFSSRSPKMSGSHASVGSGPHFGPTDLVLSRLFS